MQKLVYFTQKGYEDKQKEYADLLAQRPEAVKDLAKAREMGDLSENGYYKSARMKLSQVDREIRHLKYLLKIARVKETKSNGTIDIGSLVTISDGTNEKTYSIVGTYEANPREGKISLDSPLGKILAGKSQGDHVILQRENGKTDITILQIT